MTSKNYLKFSYSMHELYFMHDNATVTEFFLHFLLSSVSGEISKLVCG